MASNVTEAEEGHGLLSHTQFVEGSANKRLRYEVHRAGYRPKTELRRRAERYNEWKSLGGTTPSKSPGARRSTRTIRPEEGEWKRVSHSSRAPKTKLHPHG